MSYGSGYRQRSFHEYQHLVSNSTSLEVRQHPKHALVTPEHKEKGRKPIDPPPIVELKVDPEFDNGHSNWLVNPFIWMNALLVDAEPGEDGRYTAVTPPPIIGQNVSSLHRLKDVNNKDGGFFVFGDISVRVTGTFRLQFNLFDMDKQNNAMVFVNSIISDDFEVVPQKEFRGLAESTHLSRTFSDQGVRLRLRKEPRTLQGHGTKRAFDSSPITTSTPVQYGMYGGHERHYGYNASVPKRGRSDSEYQAQRQMMPGQPFIVGPNQYGGHMESGSHSWATLPGQGLQPDPSTNFTGMLGQSHHTMVNDPLWQRSSQQMPYSTSGSVGGGSYFGPGSVGLQTRSHTGNYPHHQSQQSSRSSDELQPGITGLQTPSSLPDTGYSAGHQPNVQQPPSSIAGQTDSLPIAQAYDAHRPAFRPTAVGPDENSIGPLGYYTRTSNTTFDTPFQGRSLPYGQPTRPEEQHTYQTQQRQPYPSSSNPMSDTSLALDAGVLNRGFVPPYTGQQQTPYGSAVGGGQELDDYSKAAQQPARTIDDDNAAADQWASQA